ncbi:amidase [Lysinibacillus sp. PLM2]|nr:amidase [Lysinibacillus sp. PLM2]
MESHAFFDETITILPKREGLLSGMTFAVKDVYEVSGHRNSAGNPTWYETHEKGNQTAPVIERLLDNGATLKGMTHTDELMYSLNGENIHYGTPLNPIAPNCIPGGSSSGSASVVACGITDFALGTDTGGSVRVPSSYCGLFGIRPTHDLIPCNGVIPLAPSFDTVGWMAKTIETLEVVGSVLLPNAVDTTFNHFYIEENVWSLMNYEDRELLENKIPKGLSIDKIDFKSIGLFEWPELFKRIQGIEAWRAHGEWITYAKPKFSEAIHGRFQYASSLNPVQYNDLKKQQAQIAWRVSEALGEDGIIIIPTVASVAPEKNAPGDAVESVRALTMQLTCIAGISGLPQVTVPVLRGDGMTLGLSFIANKHCDRSLLKFVRNYFGSK